MFETAGCSCRLHLAYEMWLGPLNMSQAFLLKCFCQTSSVLIELFLIEWLLFFYLCLEVMNIMSSLNMKFSDLGLPFDGWSRTFGISCACLCLYLWLIYLYRWLRSFIYLKYFCLCCKKDFSW